MSKVFNGIVLGCLVMLAVTMLGVLGGRPPTPRTAAAFSTENDAAQPCQVVIDRMGMVQQIVRNEMRMGKLKPLGALGECVSQERQIDNSKCPADFRIAQMRFVAAEDSLLRHAKMNSGSQADLALTAVFDILAHHQFDYADWVSDEMKRDLDGIQSARLDLIRIAMNYGAE